MKKIVIELSPEGLAVVRGLVERAVGDPPWSWSFSDQRDAQDALDALTKAEREAHA